LDARERREELEGVVWWSGHCFTIGVVGKRSRLLEMVATRRKNRQW